MINFLILIIVIVLMERQIRSLKVELFGHLISFFIIGNFVVFFFLHVALIVIQQQMMIMKKMNQYNSIVI
jgi:hypothetical protein